MQSRRLFATLIPTGGVGLLCLCLTGGCTDETKTTGTQLQLTEDDKAVINAMRDANKGRRTAAKQDNQEKAKEQKKGG
jgi:hypothetical protein